MSWLDNVVAWISPEAGAKRAAWRATYNELRNYDAGNNSRLNAGWRAANYSAEMTDRTSRDTIRARARDLERNSDIANSLISAYKRNVIGAGYNLQAKTKNAKLNADIEKLWKKWCKARNCDVTGTQTLNQILRMAVTRKKVDGKTLTPGMIKELNAGDEVQVVNPTGQGSDATSFTKLQQRMIGAGQGLSYEATSRDMSETNYASARQGAIEDEMTYQEEEEAILAILDEIYETFVISCYLTGLIKVNKDFWTKKDDYLEHGWIKSPKKWIDPLKESSANKTALNTGQKTYKEIAAENGRDWKQQIDDNLEVIEYAKKKGYDLGGVIFDGKLGSEKEEPKPEPPKPDDQTGDGQEEGTNDDDKGTQSGDGKEGQSASDEGQE